MTLTQVDDSKIYYEIFGDGFPLLMIHGLSEHSHSWDPKLTKGLSKKFKVILFDVPGSGRSELSEKEPSVKLFADQTSRLMDNLGIPKAHVLGTSMGGSIAQEFVLNYPKKVEKLILCSSQCGGSRFIPPSIMRIQKPMDNKTNRSPEDPVRNSIRLLFTEEFIRNNSDYIENYIQRKLAVPVTTKGLLAQTKALKNFSSYERLPLINVPTLILHGNKDILVPPQNATILAEAIPNSKLIFFENSAHYLAEEIESVLETIISFLD